MEKHLSLDKVKTFRMFHSLITRLAKLWDIKKMTLNSQAGTIHVNIANWKSHAETPQPCHHPAQPVGSGCAGAGACVLRCHSGAEERHGKAGQTCTGTRQGRVKGRHWGEVHERPPLSVLLTREVKEERLWDTLEKYPSETSQHDWYTWKRAYYLRKHKCTLFYISKNKTEEEKML